MMEIENVPVQPPEESWEFVKELTAPVVRVFDWEKKDAESGFADLGGGVNCNFNFPDSDGVLETAYDDLEKYFFEASIEKGSFKIETLKVGTGDFESFALEVTEDSCTLQAGDAEGIRRAIYYIEDEMMRNGGAFLKLGRYERSPWIKQRISRCYFGPIKRPPKMRDELMDNVDYYPDEYLNRLAHEGINGLWMTVEFRDLCKTKFTPDYGKDAPQRFTKLRRTVEKCRRYGIKIYIFCFEPRGGKLTQTSVLYPEFTGSINKNDSACFCTASDNAQQYLYKATNIIFSEVPHLGGIMNVSYGEVLTTCASTYPNINCPRCKGKRPWEILKDSLGAMQRGMKAANPNAVFIAGLYIPENGTGVDINIDWVREIAENMPEEVIIQYNFESGGKGEQLGKMRHAGDFWLSYIGPGKSFREVAEGALKNNTAVSAKLQVGCSHEVASVPFLPVPALLYHKFKAMRKLGVSSMMMCWYFGNYPGIMNKAACELSFAPFPATEDEFLHKLAGADWGKFADEVTAAWKVLGQAYTNYPLNHVFQYYGPMHDGVVWPLYLKPVEKTLSPTWLLWGPSGDRIGECVTYSHTIEEVFILCRNLAEGWELGIKMLEKIKPFFRHNFERIKDFNVIEALGIQFRSGANIIEFYKLREEMFRTSGVGRLVYLERMKELVLNELDGSQALLKLADKDSRLGFHPEAEGYKYYPAKLLWRIKQLESLLETDFVEVQRMIETGRDLFPEYTGKELCGKVYEAVKTEDKPTEEFWVNIPFVENDEWYAFEKAPSGVKLRWKSCYDNEAFYFKFEADGDAGRCIEEVVSLRIEPKRGWSPLTYEVKPNGDKLFRRFGAGGDPNWDVEVKKSAAGWCGEARIPFSEFGNIIDPLKAPVRVNVFRDVLMPSGGLNFYRLSWMPFKMAERSRLGYRYEDFNSSGWYSFK